MKARLVLLLALASAVTAATPKELLEKIEKREKGPGKIANVQSGFTELLARHPDAPELGTACVDLLFHAPATALPLLEKALAAKLPRATEGLARYVRARQLFDHYNNVAPMKRDAHVADVRKQVAELAKFADVKIWDDTVGNLTRRMVYELDHLMPGQPAPAAAGVDLDGKPIALADFRGQVVALSFWGAWCPPCVAALPGERKFVDSMKGKPFALVGVNTDVDKAKGIAIAKKNGVTWRSFWDKAQDGPICTAYGVSSFPTVYVIDKKGIIRHRTLPPDEELLREAVTPLLAEKD